MIIAYFFPERNHFAIIRFLIFPQVSPVSEYLADQGSIVAIIVDKSVELLLTFYSFGYNLKELYNLYPDLSYFMRI